MKKILKIIFFAFVILYVSNFKVFAEETKAPTLGNPNTGVMIADTNIFKAKLSSQEGNVFTIDFIIANGKNIQTGIKYGVELIKNDEGKTIVVDDYIYDESLTLIENTRISKNITYKAPEQLSGDYELYLVGSNDSGLVFSKIKLGDIKLESNFSGVSISTDKCFIKDSISEKIYKSSDVVRQTNDSEFYLNCEIVNSSNENISLLPTYEIRDNSVYGSLVENFNKDNIQININTGEKKMIESKIPKLESPGSYYVSFVLNSDKYTTNKFLFDYNVDGQSAHITNLSLDKDYYIKGEIAKLNLSYSNYNVPSLFAEVSINNKKDKSCSSLVKTDISSFSPIFEIPVLINSECKNPQILVRLVDNNGVVYDEKNFNVESISIKNNKINPLNIIIPIAIVVFILIIFFITKKMRNNKKTVSINTPIGLLFIGLLSLSLSLIGYSKAEAASFLSSDGYVTAGLTLPDGMEYYSKADINFTGYVIIKPLGVYAEDVLDIDLQVYTDSNFRSGYVRKPTAEGNGLYLVSGVVKADESRGEHNIYFDVSYSYINNSNQKISKSENFIIKYNVHKLGIIIGSINKGSVDYNSKDIVYWEAIDAKQCDTCEMVVDGKSGPCPDGFKNTPYPKLSGSFETNNLTKNTTFNITCDNNDIIEYTAPTEYSYYQLYPCNSANPIAEYKTITNTWQTGTLVQGATGVYYVIAGSNTYDDLNKTNVAGITEETDRSLCR